MININSDTESFHYQRRDWHFKMDLKRDFAEQNELICSRGLNRRQIRRLHILYHKYWMELQLLCFEFPPRKPNDEENAQVERLRDAVRSLHVNPRYLTNIELTAHSELLDEIQLESDLKVTVHHLRPVKYSLIMSLQYLRHNMSGYEREAQAMMDPVLIRSQQTAICGVMYKAAVEDCDDRVPNERILGIVDLLKYVNPQSEKHDDCSICYEALREPVPVLSENNITRGAFQEELGVYKMVVSGILPPFSHCVAQLPCGHQFGAKCIWKWMLQNLQCPLCRRRYALELRKYYPLLHIVDSESDSEEDDDDDDDDADEDEVLDSS